MHIDNVTTLIIIIIIVVLVIYVFQKCHWTCNTTQSEKFGQDASIRVQSGWIAGPRGMYGYDPIDQFASQISAIKARKRAEKARNEISLEIMKSTNLIDSPTKFVGPINR